MNDNTENKGRKQIIVLHNLNKCSPALFEVLISIFDLHEPKILYKNGEIEKPDVPMMYWYYINNDYLYYMDEEMLRKEGRSAVKRYSLTKKTTEILPYR